MRRVLVLRGDGVGSEIVGAAMRTVDAALGATGGPKMDWVELGGYGCASRRLSGERRGVTHVRPRPQTTMASQASRRSTSMHLTTLGCC